MGAATEVVDNSSPVVARSVALGDAADHHRHVGCVYTRAVRQGTKKQVIEADRGQDRRRHPQATRWRRQMVKCSTGLSQRGLGKSIQVGGHSRDKLQVAKAGLKSRLIGGAWPWTCQLALAWTISSDKVFFWVHCMCALLLTQGPWSTSQNPSN